MTSSVPCPLVYSALIITALMCGLRADACDMPVGYTVPTTVEKVLRAPYVLYGRVQRTFKDPQFDYSGSDVYTAQLDVYCSLKGPSVTQVFNVSQAGQVPGHCTSTELITGQEYFVLLNSQYLPHGLDFDEINATEENTREVTQACGLMRLYPHGVSEATARKVCPQVASSKDCVSETKISGNDTDHRFSLAIRNGYSSGQERSTLYSTLVLSTSLLINVLIRKLIGVI